MEKLLVKSKRTIEKAVPVLAVFTFCLIMQTNLVFASSGSEVGITLIKDVLNLLIKGFFMFGGGAILIFGIGETIIAIFGQNPDAKNKAILGLSAGAIMLIFGFMILGQVDTIVGFLTS